jgi:multidrug efflux pump subunit AcrB
MCYAIIFGLAVSTVTSLVIVPCLYYLFTRKGMSEEHDLK